MDNLLHRIELGEDSSLELKRISVTGKRVAEPDSRDMADEFAAAANSQGTTFLLGVSDRTREIIGIAPDKLDIVETWVRDICNDAVKPPIQASIRKIALLDSHGAEKSILRVDVPKSLFVHKGPHGYFYRIGSSKREMSPEQLARLFQQRSQTRLVCFDEQIVAVAKTTDLAPQFFGRFRTPLSPSSDAEFLRKLHFIAKDEDGVWRPTVGGILMSCAHPEEFLPSAYIQAVCYRGTERNANDQLDARDITGPLDGQIFEACRFVSRNMRIAAVKSPARIDIPQYAMNAVFEAVTNAVAHRDYSISGAKIRLHMFADRLEIMSPGGLPNSMAVEEIGERQFARNELICTCLSRCPLEERFTEVDRSRIMDRRGEGVPVILSASRRQSGASPEYRLSGDAELKLTIFSAPVENRAALLKIAANLSSRKRESLQTQSAGVERLKALVVGNPMITQAEMAKACGVSRTTINNWIRKSNGAIRRVGFDNGGHWEVVGATKP
jgi:predicted HTH transcriptional regulator